jgi:ABC-2 type transport system ATP-binding protein
MTNAIEIKNLCKQYPAFALRNVSFTVPSGLCCGFVGPNGAGKTTTLKAMLGMVSKKSGDILLLGKPDGDVSVKEELGVMFDQPYFQEDWTPLDIEKGIKTFYARWDGSEFRKYLSRFEHSFQAEFTTMFLLICVSLLSYAIMNLSMFPILFKIGYAKGKAFGVYIPVGVLLAVAYFFIFLWNYKDSARVGLISVLEWSYTNTVWAAVIILAVSVIIFAISYALSQRVYSKREF